MSDGILSSDRYPFLVQILRRNPPMSIPDEQRFLEGLRNLDAQVIAEVYDTYFPVVYRYVRYRLNDQDQSQDVASDVFVRLLEAVQARRGPETNLKAWLLATASHRINDMHRKAYRRRMESLPETLADPVGSPVEDYEIRERKEQVRQALAGLTDEQQHVLALRFGDGFSIEETANLMKKNVNAVKQLQFRALAALHRKVEEVL